MSVFCADTTVVQKPFWKWSGTRTRQEWVKKPSKILKDHQEVWWSIAQTCFKVWLLISKIQRNEGGSGLLHSTVWIYYRFPNVPTHKHIHTVCHFTLWMNPQAGSQMVVELVPNALDVLVLHEHAHILSSISSEHSWSVCTLKCARWGRIQRRPKKTESHKLSR